MFKMELKRMKLKELINRIKSHKDKEIKAIIIHDKIFYYSPYQKFSKKEKLEKYFFKNPDAYFFIYPDATLKDISKYISCSYNYTHMVKKDK